MQEAYHFSPFLSRSLLRLLSFSLPLYLHLLRFPLVSFSIYLAYLHHSRWPDPSQGVLPRVQLSIRLLHNKSKLDFSPLREEMLPEECRRSLIYEINSVCFITSFVRNLDK